MSNAVADYLAVLSQSAGKSVHLYQPLKFIAVKS